MNVAAGVQDERSTNTGWSNARFGLILFLISEVILFGALFAIYFYNRALSNGWPPAGESVRQRAPWEPALVLTFILLASCLTCNRALAAIQFGRQVGMLGWLSATIALGLLFLAGQAIEFAVLISQGLTPASGIYGTTFFSLTGLHALHVAFGIALLVATYARGLADHFTPQHHFGLEGVTWYWDFVFLVWVPLFLATYLL